MLLAGVRVLSTLLTPIQATRVGVGSENNLLKYNLPRHNQRLFLIVLCLLQSEYSEYNTLTESASNFVFMFERHEKGIF